MPKTLMPKGELDRYCGEYFTHFYRLRDGNYASADRDQRDTPEGYIAIYGTYSWEEMQTKRSDELRRYREVREAARDRLKAATVRTVGCLLLLAAVAWLWVSTSDHGGWLAVLFGFLAICLFVMPPSRYAAAPDLQPHTAPGNLFDAMRSLRIHAEGREAYGWMANERPLPQQSEPFGPAPTNPTQEHLR